MNYLKKTSMALVAMTVATSSFAERGWKRDGGMDYYQPYNDCVNKTRANVKTLDGWGGNGSSGGERCVHVASLRSFSGSVLAQFGLAAHDDDIENSLNDILDATQNTFALMALAELVLVLLLQISMH